MSEINISRTEPSGRNSIGTTISFVWACLTDLRICLIVSTRQKRGEYFHELGSVYTRVHHSIDKVLIHASWRRYMRIYAIREFR